MVVIDAKELIIGRFATHAAKMAMRGEDVAIVNCEQAVFSGTEDEVLAKMTQRRDRRTPSQGPHFPRQSDLIVRRAVRGMLPHKTPRGRAALARVRCHVGIPAELEKAEPITFEEAHIAKLPKLRYVTVKRISEHLGGKR